MAPITANRLILASMFGHIRMIHRISGSNLINAPDHKNRTPLWWAVDKNQEAAVEVLLEMGANDVADFEGRTPLITAVRGRYFSIVRLLCSAGTQIETLSYRVMSPLVQAVIYGDLQIVETLLHGGADINKANRKGKTALAMAIRCGHDKVVRLLLQRGADPDIEVFAGKIPLLMAVKSLYPKIMKLLLESGANPNHKDRQGQTPLSIAAEKGYRSLLFMMDCTDGPDPNPFVKNLGTSVGVAARSGHRGIVKYFLELDQHRETVDNLRSSDASTQLNIRLAYERAIEWRDVIQTLIDYGADPELKDCTVGPLKCDGAGRNGSCTLEHCSHTFTRRESGLYEAWLA